MNANNRNALFSSQMKSIEEDLTPFGFIDTGIPDEYQPEVSGGDLWLSDKYQKDLSEFIREKQW
jgi:hypothetical protein